MGRVFRISVASMGLIMWRFLPYRILLLCAAGLLALELVGFVLLGYGDLALGLLGLLAVILVAGLVVVLGHAVWRVADPNRLVLLSTDGGACVDIIVKTRSRLSLANHGRLLGSAAAPALRRGVARWVESLDGYAIDIRAQNRRVAEHYVSQFPQLAIGGRDWMGHVRLVARPQ